MNVPSALAMVTTSVLTPTLVRRIAAGRLIALALLVSAGGFAVLTQVDSALGAAAGLIVVYLGQGPIMALGTELVVGAAPPERAGAALSLVLAALAARTIR